MKKMQRGLFFHRLYKKKEHFPFSGQIELTYQCSLNCVHCYCQRSEVRGQKSEVRELTTEEWKRILDEISQEGCINLCLTGGDPLARSDFLELYSYAKSKGFIITLFTNGQLFTTKIIDYLVKSPPFSIEITLNGITQKTYESITQIPGSFSKVMQTINLFKQKKLPLVLKANCLKQNKYEIAKIKAFTGELFTDLPRNRFRFKYDPMIYPRYNRDTTPCNFRLSIKELLEVIKQDKDIWKEYQKGLKCKFSRLKRSKDFLYNCNAWFKQYFINPYGYLKFCTLSNKLNVNLKTTPLREGFYRAFPQLLREKFKTDSKCIDCRLRPVCYRCPARAYIETGNEEAPVPYYCQLAEATYRAMKRAKKNRISGNQDIGD